MALNAIVQAAESAGWQQAIVLGTSPDEPAPDVGGLDSGRIRRLVFESESLPFPLPGMSDVMPYRSSRFSELSEGQLLQYRDAWRNHLTDVIKRFRPQVIHSHHIWLLSSLVKDIAPSIPVVTHCHGTGLRQLALCPGLAPEVRMGCSRNDVFLLLHQGHADALGKELSVKDNRMSIIGSGYREDVFHSRGRSGSCGPVITYAGKLSAAKGVPWLLDAFERLVSGIPDLKLHIAGSGSGLEADAIRTRINTARNVVFHGQLNPEQLADLLRRSSVFVLPSFFEGLPLVLIEAAACGCHLVATELPGVVDQLKPELGGGLELVPLPRLVNTDQPVAADLPQFVHHLAQALEVSLARSADSTRPSLEGMTWSSVFEKVQRVWRALMRG